MKAAINIISGAITLGAILLTVCSPLAYGEVWQAENQWNRDFELKYSQWVSSSAVHREIFAAPDSPYYGVAVDCADLIFAIRAIFAFTHSLPFAIKLSENDIITNQEAWFDGIKDPIRRLKTFIDYFLDDSGTEQLAKLNSYPIDPATLQAGDIYITQWKNDRKVMVGHGYLIKNVLSTGYLHLLYSTTPRTPRILLERFGMPYRLPLDNTYWGFRRLFTPQQLIPHDSVAEPANISFRQYEILKETPALFFNYIRDLLKVEDEQMSESIIRQARNLCGQLVQRISLVNLSLEQLGVGGHRTTSPHEYELYSTPDLDKSIYLGIKDLIKQSNSLNIRSATTMVQIVGPNHVFHNANTSDSANDDQLPAKIKAAINYLKGVAFSSEAKKAMEDLCLVPIGNNVYFSLRDYYLRYSKKQLSSNPNHKWAKRWGILPSPKLR
ncbi:MAG: hypothetical protein HN353_07345 [Bdellovibrionales bacterium]|mgnify:CR=1 FL=1|jgi:hypothetical protein|nr:hypothetical protein [Bdellovibrionales bacterium]MBT3526625.1 hypothetical protein [Bdellovibrionales bacterium]MBT7668620.1 hypothetical protein [Bdellovibrionales bacterium]MBT7766647.1 hypothetical protein [Bdellovibrionales bacterium]